MSGGVSAANIAMMVAGTAATAIVSQAMAPKPPPIQKPTPPPQATKAADRNAALAGNLSASRPGGSLAGNSGTFLTGPNGIDPGSLNLGKNVLLGQ